MTPYYIQVASGEVRRDWCDRCQTSAALTFDFYHLGDDGPRRLGAIWGCTRCDPAMFTEPEPAP